MASLGIWPFETSKPHTEVERWLSVFFVFFTATIYAWLAGVIVELVSRAGETTRDVDGIFDGLVNYMESINLPQKKMAGASQIFLACQILPSSAADRNEGRIWHAANPTFRTSQKT